MKITRKAVVISASVVGLIGIGYLLEAGVISGMIEEIAFCNEMIRRADVLEEVL